MATEAFPAENPGISERPPLTVPGAMRWLLRNLVLLMGAFYPAMLILISALACAGRPPDERCGGENLIVLPIVWLWYAVPVLVLGGAHVAVLLAVAWRWPRAARVLAIVSMLALAVFNIAPRQLRGWPFDVPLIVMCILYYAFMLRLDPRPPLNQARWVWWIPIGFAIMAVAAAIAGV